MEAAPYSGGQVEVGREMDVDKATEDKGATKTTTDIDFEVLEVEEVVKEK